MTSSPPRQLLDASQTWQWRGFSVAYQQQGQRGPALVLVHGFGASWGHWRKTIPVLAETCRVYALDLIGFGGSTKPQPGQEIEYTFETWGQQVADFCREVVGTPAVLAGNSIGCLVVMQTAIEAPEWVQGTVMLNCSLRLLHDRRRAEQPWHRRLGTPLLQGLLANRWLGHQFFRMIAKPDTVRKILRQAYARDEAVTDELVELLMAPTADPGAADVFLAFTRYSQGPLPEDLLALLPCPAVLIWGAADPWEPIALGQKFADYPCVQQFIPLEGVGHCPQDEAPELINPLLHEWVQKWTVERSTELN